MRVAQVSQQRAVSRVQHGGVAARAAQLGELAVESAVPGVQQVHLGVAQRGVARAVAAAVRRAQESKPAEGRPRSFTRWSFVPSHPRLRR